MISWTTRSHTSRSRIDHITGATPQPEPVTFRELLARAWSMYRTEPWLFIALAAVTVIPVGILRAIATGAATETQSTGRAVAIILIAVIPALLLLPVSGAAVSVAVLRRLVGDRVGVGASLERVGLRFWILFAALVLVTLGVLVGLFALVIPGIFLAILWLFTGQVVVIEGKGVTDALRRSQDLVRGSWWTVFVAYLLITVVTAMAQIILGTIGTLVFLPLDGALASTAVGIWSTLTQLIVEPFMLIAIALLYADRCIRHDGSLPTLES